MLPAERTTNASRAAGSAAGAGARRVLVVCAAGCDALSAALTGAGFEAREARDPEVAARAVAEFAPHLLIVASRRGANGDEFLEFARRLRTDEATRSLPLVVLCRRGDEEARTAALELGADDCFSVSTLPREALARVDALLWRDEAGRRHAARRAETDALERRAEIDDFMRLLEAARAASQAGERFSLALLAPLPAAATRPDAPAAESDAQVVRAAHEFLGLNLRRADAVAFYGPTLLAVLMPRRARAARTDITRLLFEFEDARPGSRLAFGLASFPHDGADVEQLIERADAELNSVLRPAPEEAREGDDEGATPAEFQVRFQFDGGDAGAQSLPPGAREDARKFSPHAQSESVAPDATRAKSPHDDEASGQSHQRAGRSLPSDVASRRAVRESKQGHEFEAALLPYAAPGGPAGEGVLGRAAAEAAARERERRASGVAMPRRVLLTVSDPARMAQINLLLRSAAYEVRAAFDGGQALDLLRIERADVLVLDYGLKVLDGLSVLRRLNDRHRGRLPMPVALLLPAGGDCERLREEARACGATGFVQLPYDPAELLECVRTTGGKD